MNKLDDQRGYCIDIRGHKERAKVQRGLQAHTCYSYQGQIGVDQAFDTSLVATGRFYLPAFEVCMEAENSSQGSHLILTRCANQDLQKFDLAIIAKPTKLFSEKEKLVLDQFIINGGKTLWMLENVQADTDSLYNGGKMLAYPRDLNLTDLFFSYGLRINATLIQDLYAAKIPLATGNIGNKPQFQNLNWFYHPLVSGNPTHAITKNIAPVRLRFANQIDTIQNNLKKTPLLMSSMLTKKNGTPAIIELESIADEPKEEEYSSGFNIFSLLVEGDFNSMYAKRIKPFELNKFTKKSNHNKMIIISDGDIGRNQIKKGKPFDLAEDKWTGEQFGNKEFLLNAVDYLLDDTGVIELRNKNLKINLLDKKRAFEERTFWQFINIALPLLILTIFGYMFHYLRKRKYS